MTQPLEMCVDIPDLIDKIANLENPGAMVFWFVILG